MSLERKPVWRQQQVKSSSSVESSLSNRERPLAVEPPAQLTQPTGASEGGWSNDSSWRLTPRLHVIQKRSNGGAAGWRGRTIALDLPLQLQLRSGCKVTSRSFVVNFRRLIEVHKIFNILHEFIKSTAIAALTLVVVGSPGQLVYSMAFVAVILCIYGLHNAKYDAIDISDYTNLVDLLQDDEVKVYGNRVENPNRSIKALTLSRSVCRFGKAVFIIVVLCVVDLLLWSGFLISFLDESDLPAWVPAILGEGDVEDDVPNRATLLLVGTLMLVLHSIFEWLYWRETQCVMPPSPDVGAEPGAIWDIKKDGVPRAYQWYGLPSMWFVSKEVRDDLLLWATYARGKGDKPCTFFPEELAIFALDTARGAGLIRATLSRAKLYCARQKCFVARGPGLDEPMPVEAGGIPEELGIDLVYLDRANLEFLQPEEADHKNRNMRMLWSPSASNLGLHGASPMMSKLMEDELSVSV